MLRCMHITQLRLYQISGSKAVHQTIKLYRNAAGIVVWSGKKRKKALEDTISEGVVKSCKIIGLKH